MAVESTSPRTSRWTIQGPLGIEIYFNIRVTEERANRVLRYQTITLPGIRTYWEVYFAAGAKSIETVLREVMKVPRGKFGRAALAFIGKSSACEVAANLQRLKQLMEKGKVADVSYSVEGKFRAN
jgi:uncharacterized membrane protein